ncbi:hypothetical protein H072_4493 [Dactylellina haptotyla CBS 200.50]|uniref:Rhodopsin domain-containing protein n=1 Tax=Dactylellina haptotyla (strain CBS 200.50) TaxID=1284197 RepID=S8AKG9_DACHA|nr:hypothetical protein H072_4493 [Dactylellina haptotyla CBS 200.50]
MALSGQGTISVEWCLVVLTLNLVVLRLVARLLVQRDRVNIGDVLLVFAWLAFSSMAACDTWLLKLGLMEPSRTYNQDLAHLSADSKRNVLVLKIVYGSVLPYYTSLWLIKCTILSFYYTIIPTSLPIHRKALNIVTGAVLLSMLGVLCVNIFWCMPVNRNWSLNREEICFSFATIPVFIISTACNILTDVAIFILPFPLIRNIKFQRRSQLFGVISIFALGCFAMLASVVRVAILADTATLTHVAVWSAVEVAVGIIIASLPSLRILVWKKGGLISVASTARSREIGESGVTCTTSSRPGGALDWISLEEKSESDTLRSKNRDTIKSHSTVITVPTVEELEEIVCDNRDMPTIRSIHDLQKYHDSVRHSRDPNDPSPKVTQEWNFDKVQWRYSEPEPPSPISFHGLGVIPDVPPLPPLLPLPVRTVQQSRRSR